MMTALEFSRLNKVPDLAFLYGLDVLDHVLKGHTMKTIYKCPDTLGHCLDELKAEIRRPIDHTSYNAALDEITAPRRKHRERDADTGDINIERYIDGDLHPFTDVFTETTPKPALTILIDAIISMTERNKTYLTEAHAQAFALCLKAEQEGTPCRVIACRTGSINEASSYTMAIVIKDWIDPIFPEIWGGLKSNFAVNAFGNCIADFLIGTYTIGNSHPQVTYAEDITDPGEEIIIFGKLIKRREAQG